jgi:hypothetical protein
MRAASRDDIREGLNFYRAHETWRATIHAEPAACAVVADA